VGKATLDFVIRAGFFIYIVGQNTSGKFIYTEWIIKDVITTVKREPIQRNHPKISELATQERWEEKT
jgi:hypothetical protein